VKKKKMRFTLDVGFENNTKAPRVKVQINEIARSKRLIDNTAS
jgi:hypothetical protein